MKKAFMVVMMMAWMTGLAFAGAGNGISGSTHDFSNESWNSSGEVCITCHTPHDQGSNRGDIGLLWNHDLSTATYLMYAEDTHTMFIDGASDPEPTGMSKLCLGCHDGTVGLDQFGGGAGTVYIGGGDKVPNVADVGGEKDLSSTHPVSIVYDPAADLGLMPTSNAMGTSGTIADVLEGGKVQCASCHDVHDSESVPGTKLLRVSQTAPASGLCLTCHIK